MDGDLEDSSPDFTKPDEFSDLTLVVEDKKLYVHKVLLAAASPVWRCMFLSDFHEKTAKEIPLPDKQYQHILALLNWIYPSVQARVNADSVVFLLALANEYQIARLKRECELTLSQQIGKSSPTKKVVEYLKYAIIYQLPRLEEKVISLASRIARSTVESTEEYKEMDYQVQEKIMKKRIDHLESANKTLGENLEQLKKDMAQFEETQSKERTALKDCFRSIQTAFGYKVFENGSPKFCSDHEDISHEFCLSCNIKAREYIIKVSKSVLSNDSFQWPICQNDSQSASPSNSDNE